MIIAVANQRAVSAKQPRLRHWLRDWQRRGTGFWELTSIRREISLRPAEQRTIMSRRYMKS